MIYTDFRPRNTHPRCRSSHTHSTILIPNLILISINQSIMLYILNLNVCFYENIDVLVDKINLKKKNCLFNFLKTEITSD